MLWPMVAAARRKRWILAAGALCLALVLAEGLTRLIAPAAPTLRFEQDTAELRAMNLHAATSIIESDPDRFWRLKPDTRLTIDAWPFPGVIANAQGFREARTVPREKPDGEFRILFLGDSCTFGYGVGVEQTFVQQVEARLREQRGGAPVECINAGVPGYSLLQGWRLLTTEGLGYTPDLVVLNFGWNDYAEWDHRSDLEHYAAAQALRPPGPLRGSRLARLLWSAARGTEADASAATARPRILPAEFADLLGRIEQLAVAGDMRVLILVWPMRGNTEPATPADFRTELQAEMIQFGARSDQATALDLVPLARALVAERGADAVYLDKGHMSALGHARVAAAIVTWLDENGGR